MCLEERKQANLMAFNFKITKNIATLGTSSRGWTKELNLVSWNDRMPKYDIREWDEDHEKCGKGVTFSEEEFLELVSSIGGDLSKFKNLIKFTLFRNKKTRPKLRMCFLIKVDNKCNDKPDVNNCNR